MLTCIMCIYMVITKYLYILCISDSSVFSRYVQGLSVSLISQEPNFGTINTYYCLLSSFYTNLTLQLYIVTGLQNLCISSSLVCVIILIASLVVFWVGFILRQVPPVLIVSVLYVLAGNSKQNTMWCLLFNVYVMSQHAAADNSILYH